MGTRGNPICFHAARMPMTAMVVALGMRLLGDHYLRVACFKTLLLLLPIELCLVSGVATSAASARSTIAGCDRCFWLRSR